MLSDGEKKITETIFTRMSNTSDFLILKEDHTLGNVITEQLRGMSNVMMAAYKIGHPNVPEVLLRIQTDGTITAREALSEACKSLVLAYGQLETRFSSEMSVQTLLQHPEPVRADGGAVNGTYY